jgi:hypothetical protein
MFFGKTYKKGSFALLSPIIQFIIKLKFKKKNLKSQKNNSFILLLLNNYSISTIINMISNITTILYILSVSDEIINNGTLQKGTAVSRVDGNDELQIYKYSNYLTSASQTDSDSSDDIATTSFEKDNMYLTTGKFCISSDDSISVTIISSVHIALDKEDMPIMKPTVHFVGKIMNHVQLTDIGYTLQIQVKPYLSKEQFNPFLVNLTHPVNGRFKNALTKAMKNSTIHCTGLFFLANKEVCCEILEFQFIPGKIESDNNISVPWKNKTDSSPSSSKTKSAVDRRIDLIRQNLETKTSPLSDTSKQSHKKRKTFLTKTSEISKSLLSQDQQNQRIEISDSDEEIYDNEKIEDDDEDIVEGNNENNEGPTNISTRTRNSKKKNKIN